MELIPTLHKESVSLLASYLLLVSDISTLVLNFRETEREGGRDGEGEKEDISLPRKKKLRKKSCLVELNNQIFLSL